MRTTEVARCANEITAHANRLAEIASHNRDALLDAGVTLLKLQRMAYEIAQVDHPSVESEANLVRACLSLQTPMGISHQQVEERMAHES